MVAPVIVVLDEARDLGFEIARQVIVLEQNTVLERKVPSFDLALRLRMAVHALVFVGDAMEERDSDLYDIARELGLPAFLFQEGDHPDASRVFAEIAKAYQRRALPRSPQVLPVNLQTSCAPSQPMRSGGRNALLANKCGAAAKLLLQLPPR